jgi:hypothetical protein
MVQYQAMFHFFKALMAGFSLIELFRPTGPFPNFPLPITIMKITRGKYGLLRDNISSNYA